VSRIPLTYSTKLHLKALPLFCIVLLSANRFHFNLKRKENEFFTTSLYEINCILDDCYLAEQPNDPDNAELIQEQLPYIYKDYKDVFSKTVADQLPEHRAYDHWIVLTKPLLGSFSPLYKQSTEELEATKVYVMENL
jgi:hypothetical protein